MKFHYQQLYESKETRTEEIKSSPKETEKRDQEIRLPELENTETVRDEL